MNDSDYYKKFNALPVIGKLVILYSIWILVHLPGLVNYYYSFDDAIFYLKFPGSDLKVNIDVLFSLGRFLLPFYNYLSSLVGIDPSISNAQTWLMGIYTCFTGIFLMRCLEKNYGLGNSPIAVFVPCLYIIVSPLFVESQYLHVGVHYALAMPLSTLAYIAFCEKKLIFSAALNLAALMLSQSSGMLFYVLVLLGIITDFLYSERPVKYLVKKTIVNSAIASISIVTYAVTFLISRQFYGNQSQDRSVAGKLDFSFLNGKFNLIAQIFQRFITSGKYSSLLISICIAGILVISVVCFYIFLLQRKDLADKQYRGLAIAICLILLLPVACFPLLVVPENWASFRVSMVPAIGLIIICVLPLGWLSDRNFYSKFLSVFFLCYICLLSFHTLDIGTQKVLVFQKDMATIARIKELNDARNIDSAKVVASSEISNSNIYSIPGMVVSGTGALLESSLDPLWSLDAFLKIAQVGEVVEMDEDDKQKLLQQYCPSSIKPMTPVLSSENFTVLCK